MTLWRAYFTYADYEFYTTTVIGIFESREQADENVLQWYNLLESKTVSSFGSDVDKLELVSIEPFEVGELWDEL